MEIVTPLPVNISGTRGNTQKYVEEWFQRDRFTGMIETARVESDLWANNTSNSRHHFGKNLQEERTIICDSDEGKVLQVIQSEARKENQDTCVVNSRAKNLVDGSVQQHRKTKQLEVYQAHTPGGSVQVIRSHTSTASSWHNLKMSQSYESRLEWPSDYTDNLLHQNNTEFLPSDNLQLQHNFVNLDLERTKANIGRSRPPRRPFKRSKPQALGDEFPCNFPNITDDLSNETKDCLNVIEQKCSITSPVKLSIPTMLMNNNVDPQFEKTNNILNPNSASKIVRKGQSSPLMLNSEARQSFQNSHSNQYGISAKNRSVLERALERAMKLDCDATDKRPMKLTKPIADSGKMMNLQPTMCKRTLFVTEESLKATKQKLRHMDHAIATLSLHNSGDNEDNDNVCTGGKNNLEKEDDNAFMDDQATINDGSGADSLKNDCKNQEVATAEEWFDCHKFHTFEPTHTRTICKPPSASTNSIGFEMTSSTADTSIQQPSNLELAPKSASMIKHSTKENEENLFGFYEETSEKCAGPPVGVLELLTRFQKKLDTQLDHEICRKRQTTSDRIVCSGRVAGLIQNFYDKTCPTNVFQMELTREEDCNASKTLTEIRAETPAPNAEKSLIVKQNSTARNNVEYSSKLNPHENLELFKHPNDNSIGDKNRDTPSLGTFTNEEDATIDGKKQKKVEFSKTEVHFAVAEPGKIKIVETNEKPPPLNLHRRKKRVLSTSPKIDSSMPIIRTQRDVPIKSDTRENQRNITAGVEGGKSSDCSYFESSLASDNGLEVRILSTKPIMNINNTQSNENKNKKSGYSSTRVNFVNKDVFVVEDDKSYPASVDNKFAHDANGITFKNQNTTSFSSSSHVGEIQKEPDLESSLNDSEVSMRKTSITNEDVKQQKATLVSDDLRLQSVSSRPLKNEEDEKEEDRSNNRERNSPVPEKSSNDVIKDKKIKGGGAMVKKSKIICKENSFGGGDVMTSTRIIPKFELDNERRRQYKPVEVGPLSHDEKNVLLSAERRPSKKGVSESSKSRLGKTHFESSTVTDGMSSTRNNNIIHSSRNNVQTKGRDSWLNLPRDCEEGTGRSLRSPGSRHRPVRQKSIRALTGVQKEMTTSDSRTSKPDKSYKGLTSMSRVRNRENKILQMSKPPMLTATSERQTLKVKSDNMEREARGELSHSSHSQPRSLRTRKVEENINFLESQTPSLLKTKERSQRSAHTSERDDTVRKTNTSRSINKLKNHHYGKTARIPPDDQFKQLALLNKLDANTRRLIQQKTAKMQMNIFDLKEKPSPSRRTASDPQQSFKTMSNSTYPYGNLRPVESSKHK